MTCFWPCAFTIKRSVQMYGLNAMYQIGPMQGDSNGPQLPFAPYSGGKLRESNPWFPYKSTVNIILMNSSVHMLKQSKNS